MTLLKSTFMSFKIETAIIAPAHYYLAYLDVLYSYLVSFVSYFIEKIGKTVQKLISSNF